MDKEDATPRGPLQPHSGSSRTRILIKTFSLICAWVAYGMQGNIIPATLADLTNRFQTDQSKMSLALSAGTMGAVVGAPLSFIVDRFYSHVDLILGCVLIVFALLLMVMPIVPNLILFGVVNFFENFCSMLINSTGNSMIVALWGEKSGVPMQALHFGFPIGSMIGPLIAYPFVSHGDKNTTTGTYDIDQWLFATSYSEGQWMRDFPDHSEIEKAYWIIGLCIIVVGIVFIIYQFLGMPTVGYGVRKENKVGMSWKQVLSPSTWSPGRTRFGIIIVICMTLYYVFHVATRKGWLLYHALYAVDANFTSTQEATVLSSSINLAGTGSRALGIVLAKFLPVTVMQVIFVIGECVTAILMPFFGLGSKGAYWTFSCVFAFFREPVWPCGYLWTDQFIVLSAMIVGIGDCINKLADAFMAWLNGYMYTKVGIDSIYYISAGFAVVFCTHVAVMNIYSFAHGKRSRDDEETAVLPEEEVQPDADSVEGDPISYIIVDPANTIPD